MSDSLQNPYRGTGMPGLDFFPKNDASAVTQLLTLCPAHAPTPLRCLDAAAAQLGIASLWLKDERARMGLGSFKALGAAYAIAALAAEKVTDDNWAQALVGDVFITASAGNHGLSVAAGARIFGAKAIIYLADSVPDPFAERLRAAGAQVERAGDTYEDSLVAAERAADAGDGTLLSDGSWPGYVTLPTKVMEGYLQMAVEAATQIDSPPTHIFLQAGVGGLAAAVAAYARVVWGDGPEIIVVEPDAAPALIESLRAGEVVTTTGPVSQMGRLDCKTPSMVALAGLARDANSFVTVTEQEAADAVAFLGTHRTATTPSGAAGVAAVLATRPALGSDARVLCIISEGSEDG
ncbi:PLP-dependent lyase/thiolase [Loktanella sp. D2R18]|uniref:pyridoxal-phosphate dependent enzyme n=1 Tax=Rhodobacterales TaxID=204455 RepID=UPI000DEB1A83|nr:MULTISPECIES: pyridoxal-phosphate dependent enzyme [Rhodobacterales]MDO6591660.1 pyridoxal-phosphate dependent enzyme [Yoonia sp. 1_MG-2023]RBW42495.1 PLP-dependent lyase/thiolase [Loktanella sp. D2R18]